MITPLLPINRKPSIVIDSTWVSFLNLILLDELHNAPTKYCVCRHTNRCLEKKSWSTCGGVRTTMEPTRRSRITRLYDTNESIHWHDNQTCNKIFRSVQQKETLGNSSIISFTSRLSDDDDYVLVFDALYLFGRHCFCPLFYEEKKLSLHDLLKNGHIFWKVI